VRRHKILVLTSTYPRYAQDTLPPFVHELSRRLASWFEMHVLAPHCAGAHAIEEMDGVTIHRFRYLPERLETLAYGGGILPGLRRHPWRITGLPLLLIGEYLAARRLLRNGGFALVHAHWLVPHGIIAASLNASGRPLLCTSHGSDLFALDTPWFRPLQRYALRNADALSVVSDALRVKAASLMPDAATIHVLPMGVDTVRFRPPEPERVRRGLLYVGRLVHDKGMETLLHALHLLQQRGLKPKLTVIGDGPDHADVSALAQALSITDQVEFLGPMPNATLPAHYQQAEAVIFPSLLGKRGQQEGMGLVPLEALACGCPVIASALPAVKEVVREAETGLLFPPGNAVALEACIERVLTQPGEAQRMADAGRKRVRSDYSWEHAATGYRDLYRQLIGTTGSS
jgi:glycosyltransferase involved in cell wall biosynthesis